MTILGEALERADPADRAAYLDRACGADSAEPLPVKGCEGMKEREKAIPPPGDTRIPEVLDRLVELDTATNHADDAKRYRELRAKYPAAKPPEPTK